MEFELAHSRRAVLKLGLLKYFRTVESKRSASEESFDCLLPNETSGTGQQLNFSAESVSIVASVVH